MTCFLPGISKHFEWIRHGLIYSATGKGVLNVIHDGNFVISPTILPTQYCNQHELDNGRDDDGNGLIDDCHGFDFDRQTGNLLRHGSDD